MGRDIDPRKVATLVAAAELRTPSLIRDRVVALRRVRAAELLPNPRNWRRHPERQRAALGGLLREIGYADALLARETPAGLELIDGHLRREATPEAVVPVLVLDLDDAEAGKLLATLDPLAALADTDAAALQALLETVRTEDAGLAALLRSLGQQAGNGAGRTDVDDVPEPPAAAVSERGDLWLLDGHRLLCGDSTQSTIVSRLMAGRLAALVYTDPPYGVDYDGGTKARARLAGDADVFLYGPACQMAAEFTDDAAALYLWHAGVKGIAAAAAAAAAGWEIRCELIWNKNHAQFGALSAHYKQKHEPVYYCVKRGHAPRWFGPANEVTVWDCDRSARNDYHPTQKPVALAVRAIRNSSALGDIVLDLFAGSGSTLIGAHEVGRRCYAMEICECYVDVAVKRWEAFTGQAARLEATGQTFAEVARERLGDEHGTDAEAHL